MVTCSPLIAIVAAGARGAGAPGGRPRPPPRRPPPATPPRTPAGRRRPAARPRVSYADAGSAPDAALALAQPDHRPLGARQGLSRAVERLDLHAGAGPPQRQGERRLAGGHLDGGASERHAVAADGRGRAEHGGLDVRAL